MGRATRRTVSPDDQVSGIGYNGYYHYLCHAITEALPTGNKLHTGGCGVIGSHVRLRI